MFEKVLHNVYKLLPYAVIEKRRAGQYEPFIREINEEYQKLKIQRNNATKVKSIGGGISSYSGIKDLKMHLS